MRKLILALSVVASMPVMLYSGASNAQATRTWVSGVGDDVNPCSRTAPCKTFAGAISKTAANGEINCLDPGGFGAVTITKSITIDCKNTHGSTLHSGTTGINIPFDNFTTANDVRKTVRLRGLSINGAAAPLQSTGTQGIRISGGAAATGTEVFIEDVVIDGSFTTPAIGINDLRSGGGKLFVLNTTVRNTGVFAIAVSPTTANAVKLDAVLEDVRAENSDFGVIVGFGARAIINRSVVSGNTTAGVRVTGEANVSNSVMSSNGEGVAAVSAGVIRLYNNDIVFNTTGVTGTTESHGLNRISGNSTSPGTLPTALVPLTH